MACPGCVWLLGSVVAGDEPPASISLGCARVVEGLVDDGIPLGPFIIFIRTCDFPSWEIVCLLALFPRFSFFFLIIVDSFIVVWRSGCVRDRLDSCDSNTLNLFYVRIANNGELCAEFMVSLVSRSASPVVLSTLLTLSWILSTLFFLFTRFGGRLSFNVLWKPKIVLLRKFLIHFCNNIFNLLALFILSIFFPSLIFFIVFIVSIICHLSLLNMTV